MNEPKVNPPPMVIQPVTNNGIRNFYCQINENVLRVTLQQNSECTYYVPKAM